MATVNNTQDTPILPSTLYIVATPLGNLKDITLRALETLRAVDVILVENTRHSQRLLSHFGIQKPLIRVHEHNEDAQAKKILHRLQQGAAMALISDAGTPLISDPGYRLVHLAHEMGIKISPIPGACAFIAALCASGLPTDRCVFEGFLPVKTVARRKQLQTLSTEKRTLVFYEAPHRILGTLQDMETVFGADRVVVIARELTKVFETIHQGALGSVCHWMQSTPVQQQGEFVLVLAGYRDHKQREVRETLTPEAVSLLKLLLAEVSVKQAANIAAQITGLSKRALYAQALKLESRIGSRD